MSNIHITDPDGESQTIAVAGMGRESVKANLHLILEAHGFDPNAVTANVAHNIDSRLERLEVETGVGVPDHKSGTFPQR